MKKFLFQAFHAWCNLFGGAIPVRPDPFGPVEIPVLTPPAMVPDGNPPRRPPPGCDQVREYFLALASAHGLFRDVRDSANALRMTRLLGSVELTARARETHRRAVELYRQALERSQAALAYTPPRDN